MKENINKIANFYKVLSDPVRVEILKTLAHGPLCVCQLLEYFTITQPTLSYHLKLMEKQNILKSKKEGTWVYYEMNHEMIEVVFNDFKDLIYKKENQLITTACTN
ncbi:ArsR/SmtB family transcription factor [Acholeplasma granularum]|uniref:ArsR/SmtB family transcription factor n=1 Tax=Acholeplasma granularum TaxID=264635 RepID=UPI0004724F02|nr:metalloregulator ArsR/SmtB family transcription factor [Acholeplasma granularum]